MGLNYKGFYKFRFDYVVVGCINRMVVLMGFIFYKKIYLYFIEIKKGSIIIRWL